MQKHFFVSIQPIAGVRTVRHGGHDISGIYLVKLNTETRKGVVGNRAFNAVLHMLEIDSAPDMQVMVCCAESGKLFALDRASLGKRRRTEEEAILFVRSKSLDLAVDLFNMHWKNRHSDINAGESADEGESVDQTMATAA